LLGIIPGKKCSGSYPRAMCHHPAGPQQQVVSPLLPLPHTARRHHSSQPCPPYTGCSCSLGNPHPMPMPKNATACTLKVVVSGKGTAPPLSNCWRLQRVAPAYSATALPSAASGPHAPRGLHEPLRSYPMVSAPPGCTARRVSAAARCLRRSCGQPWPRGSAEGGRAFAGR
jgi:hypothetical protein